MSSFLLFPHFLLHGSAFLSHSLRGGGTIKECMLSGKGVCCEGLCKVNVTSELHVPKCVPLYCTFNGSQKGSCDKVQVLEIVSFLNFGDKM